MTENHDPAAIQPEQAPEGISFKRVEGDIPPPAARMKPEEKAEATEEKAEEDKARDFARGGIPLHPAVIRLPASVFGRLATELSGYEGFTFTREELEDLASLWMECGIEADPRLQAMVGSVAMLGVKAGGYTAWRRQGRPGDIRAARRAPGGGD